jgi:glycine oxidase
MLTPLAEAHGADDVLPLGLESLALFPELVAELRERSGIDANFVRSGVLRVAASSAQVESLRARARRLAAHGAEWIDGGAARAREPELAGSIAGALWSPLEAHIEGDLLTAAFAGAAQGLGARIECGAPVLALLRDASGARVRGVRTPAGDWPARWVVLATGPWAGLEGAGLAVPAPVTPVRGQIAALRPAKLLLDSVVRGADAYLVPRRDGRVLVGATEERVGFDRRVTAEGLRSLLAAAPALVPALADACFEAAAAGLRPVTPDGLPLLGPAPGLEGLVLALGHSRNGILLSAITGQLVADLVSGKALPAAARAFRPDRF